MPTGRGPRKNTERHSNAHVDEQPPPIAPVQLAPAKKQRKKSHMLSLIIVFLSIVAVVLGYAFSDGPKGAKPSQPHQSSSSATSSSSSAPASSSKLTLRQRHDMLQAMPYPLDNETQVIGRLEDCKLDYVSYLLDTPRTEARPMGVKFRSFYPKYLEMFWDDGTPAGTFTGAVKSGGFTATNTYEGHVFFFKTKGKEAKEVARFEMRNSQHLYIIPPVEGDPQPPGYMDAVEESKFMQEFYNRTGSPFLGFYPRSKPTLPMWRAEKPGDAHAVITPKGFYHCDPLADAKCIPDKPLNLTMRVVSTKPRVLVIENLMSEFECKHIVGLGKEVIARSTVGDANSAFESKTRTSLNGWLNRRVSKVLDHMFSRFADVLGMSDDHLQHDRCAEELQVVKYAPGQEYTPHHDFGYTGKPNQRFLTLLMYIEPPIEGGATSFPKAYEGRGMKIKPPMGSAVLFYSMTPDGNADDLSVHAGMPVISGTKWVCNLWVWDPDKDTASNI